MDDVPSTTTGNNDSAPASDQQLRDAMVQLRSRFPACETVVLSTCNRVELYFAAEQADDCPTHFQVVEFLARFHGLAADEVFEELFERAGQDAIRHLFTVAASLEFLLIFPLPPAPDRRCLR